jgi:hypothetical protein
MEHSIHFGGEEEAVLVAVTGTSSVEGQMAVFNELIADPRYSPGMAIMIDYSGIDSRRATTADVERIGLFVAGLDRQLGDSKLAVVVPDTLAFGLGRMSQARIETRLELQLFYNRDDAARWLREPKRP